MAPLTRVTRELARKLLGSAPVGEEEKRVVDYIDRRIPISQDATELAEREDTVWDRLADIVARVGGSWPFIFGFFAFLLAWTGLNSYLLLGKEAFDPYPYIFLNLVLSMLAAIQAPIIMMSQNRQADKDRVAASHDYEVNLRSELEILGMQKKLDHIRGEQHELMLTKLDEVLQRLQSVEAALRA